MKIFNLAAESDYSGIIERLESRNNTTNTQITQTVSEIIDNVIAKGDKALFEYTRKFDHVENNRFRLKVSPGEIKDAFSRVSEKYIETVKAAQANIKAFHKKEKERSWYRTTESGSKFGIRVTPIERVGVYVPAGRKPLPSSVLMNVIPAKVAGVKEIIMCTPPDRNGKVSDYILVAAKLAGVSKIYKVGGAQAIAAMAYGTKTIGKVDKITGPGNAYVAKAKSMVFGKCGIDMIAGPSEILIIADSSADADFVAADMLSQAEHDPNAASVLITDDVTLVRKVESSLARQLDALREPDAARASIENNGMMIITRDLMQAAEIANFIAPEHLELSINDPDSLIPYIKNAGAIFCGKWSPEPMGDYYCGSNHVLPTLSTARFSSPLGVWDFVKRTSIISYSKEDFLKDADAVIEFASCEGLEAHAKSVEVRL
ncbi:MAG: histidinol dehydrogenase [Ruminococcaceae bacterium]|nr:histidinol dehydrogenase [Oscillospiraceae bacterium]